LYTILTLVFLKANIYKSVFTQINLMSAQNCQYVSVYCSISRSTSCQHKNANTSQLIIIFLNLPRSLKYNIHITRLRLSGYYQIISPQKKLFTLVPFNVITMIQSIAAEEITGSHALLKNNQTRIHAKV